MTFKKVFRTDGVAKHAKKQVVASYLSNKLKNISDEDIRDAFLYVMTLLRK